MEEGTVVEVLVPEAHPRQRRSIRELGFAGMWADRDDIEDGVAYVDGLRENPQGPERSETKG